MEAMRRSNVEFVLVSNEASAGFMADVCARLTGRPGVCYGTFGPGATNLSTGIANALLDRSPVLALTSQVPTAMRTRMTQMKIDHQALFEPISKWTAELSVDNLHETASQSRRYCLSRGSGTRPSRYPGRAWGGTCAGL